MKMTKKLFKMAIIVSLLVNGALLNAQVTVGDNTPPNATLDVVLAPGSTTPAGVIAPRVDRAYLNSTNYNNVANNDQTGAIVYVTDATVGTATGQTVNVTSHGYYYFDGAMWQPMGGATRVPNVLRGIDSDYTALATDDFLIFQTSVTRNLTFPTLTDASIGKTLYVTDSGTSGVNLPAGSLINTSHTVLYAGLAMQIIYVGQGQWEVFGGQ